MKKISNFLAYSGLWFIPIALIIEFCVIKEFNPSILTDSKVIAMMVGLSFLPTCFIYVNNSAKKSGGKKVFTTADAFNKCPDKYYQTARHKAIYPPVQAALI